MNKNVKKFLSVFLGVIMIFSLFTMTSFAEENAPALKLSVDGKVEVGNSVRLFVSVENMPQFSWADFYFYYDATNLECLGVSKAAKSEATIWSSDYNDNYGIAQCTFASYDKMQGDQDIAVVVFNVIDTENTTVTVSVTDLDCDEAPETVQFDLKSVSDTVPVQFDYDYEIVNSEVIINSCNRGAIGDIIIPETIDGYPVTTIKESAFNACDKITSVVIPDSVTTIGDFAFSGCDGLKKVTIGGGVKTLGRSIFWDCRNLESVVVENGVTYISKEMFSQCGKLNSVTLPESITSIGDSAFMCCYLLAEIDIPSNVKTIENSAFYMCSSLNNVVIPDSVTEIAEYAFFECESLKKITLSKNLKTIGQSAFSDSGLESIDIPESVTQIDGVAFAGTNLKKVVIPDGITSISGDTFHSCKKLVDVTIPDSVVSIGGYAFYGCSSMKSLNIPASVTEIGYRAIGYNEEPLPMSGFTIYGVKGSKAESYALSNRIGFTEVNETSSLFDVNGDGNISAADARLALRASAKLEVLEGSRFTAADVDKNGKVTAADARLILRKAAKLD